MARRAQHMMHITYHPDPDTLRAAQGWGQCMVEINQQPFWYGGTAQNPQTLEWTWIDLLHHLGKNWLDIITEAPWPNERLAAAMQEGKDFWAQKNDECTIKLVKVCTLTGKPTYDSSLEHLYMLTPAWLYRSHKTRGLECIWDWDTFIQYILYTIV